MWNAAVIDASVGPDAAAFTIDHDAASEATSSASVAAAVDSANPVTKPPIAWSTTIASAVAAASDSSVSPERPVPRPVNCAANTVFTSIVAIGLSPGAGELLAGTLGIVVASALAPALVASSFPPPA